MATAFLGPRGTFSEDAALSFAGPDAELLAMTSIPALSAAVETGLAADAVVPVENSIEGSVSSSLDLLIHETELRIKAELVVPVRLFLITPPGATLGDIKVVSSHPNPLGQSRRFLERILPRAEQVAALSTAAAVEEVVASGDYGRAAIGTESAAALFGGRILAHDIQDLQTNATRFVVLARSDAEPTGDDKTAIAFTVRENVPGALYKVLRPIAEEGLQLAKVESRPSREALFEYVFLADILGHRTDPAMRRVFEAIEPFCGSIKVFGSFPRFPLERFARRGSSPETA